MMLWQMHAGDGRGAEANPDWSQTRSICKTKMRLQQRTIRDNQPIPRLMVLDRPRPIRTRPSETPNMKHTKNKNTVRLPAPGNRTSGCAACIQMSLTSMMITKMVISTSTRPRMDTLSESWTIVWAWKMATEATKATTIARTI